MLVLAGLVAVALGLVAMATTRIAEPQVASRDFSEVTVVPSSASVTPPSSMPTELAYSDDTDESGNESSDESTESGFTLDLRDIDTSSGTTTTETPATVASGDPAPPAKALAPGPGDVAVPPDPLPPAGFDLRSPAVGAASWGGIGDAADPFVLRSTSGYYAFTTNTSTGHVPVWFSSDLSTWEALGDGLPNLPGWAAPSSTQTWAPAVLQRGGNFVLYFTTRDSVSNRQCIGVATSSRPEGPFVSGSSTPIVCQSGLGGSIDPSTFVDTDGQAYLLFKNDGNCCRQLTRLWTQPLSSDGLSVLGSPTELLWSTKGWEGSVIEGPSMTVVGGRYHLIYSANSWSSNRYAMGHAVCESAVGPCYKSSGSEWRESDGGPGGGEFFTDRNGSTWLVFHEWRYRIGYPGGVRSMYFQRLSFDGSPLPTTTVPPVTVSPSTVPPVTVSPTTIAPATTVTAPTTITPTSAPPTTTPPTTGPPATTVPPTTVPPTTVPPATNPPSTGTTLAS